MSSALSHESSIRRSSRIKSQGQPSTYELTKLLRSDEDNSSSEESSSDEEIYDVDDLLGGFVVDNDEGDHRDKAADGKRSRRGVRRDDEYRPRSQRSRLKTTHVAASGSKRRRIVRANENEVDDEEDVKPLELSVPPAKLESPAPSPVDNNEIPDKQMLDDRRVKLMVTTPSQGQMTIVVKPSTINKIASLSPQLKTIPSSSVPRQSINCSTLSGEEAFIQAIEFLENGTLAPLSMNPNTNGLLEHLGDRIKLFDISQELDIATLEIAVVEGLQQYVSQDVDVFARFATACYDRAAGHRVEKNSSLGKIVKAGLLRFMPEMIASGIADGLRDAGGPLAEELVDVVWTRHVKLEQQRVARMMVDREIVE